MEDEKMEQHQVFAMYDVRGIQDYIFRTSKLKHAIGASAIVESIIEKAISYAVNLVGNKDITYDMIWENVEYTEDDKDVQVLYIGGGNAFVLFRNAKIYKTITKCMSKYVIENTYSLQLAATYIEKTGNYQEDYKNLNIKMMQVKANMPESKPVGALPIMRVELSTGLPAIANDESKETCLKLEAEKIKRKNIKTRRKVFDEFIEEKGEDSTLAVIHIDGNNMGMRIRELIENKTTYLDAVNEMRKISFSINHAYKDVFEEMMNIFNKNDDYVILPVLVAGDDITYVCSGKAALASVELFVDKISRKTMTGMVEDIDKYGFSVCAGIAYIRSHFPFSTGYAVAEACCESAKDKAKAVGENKVGNFFDFQFCKNVQTIDIETIREKEYYTATNEALLTRPFEIKGDSNAQYSYDVLKKYLQVFSGLNDIQEKGEAFKKLPRSHAKTLRNTYPLGYQQVDRFKRFLESRGWCLPDGDCNAYIEIDGKKTAKYYDALELMDDYVSLEDILGMKEAL